MVGMPAADSRVRSRNICPPGMKISFCVGRSAPPDSTSEITGSRFSRAIWLARRIFFSVHGLLVPPLTVGSLATIRHSTPSTTPMPVTTLAPTVKSLPHAASGLSSRNGESGSSSSSMRSRGGQLAAGVVAFDVLRAAAGQRLGVLGVELGELGGHRLGGLGVARARAGSSVDRSAVMTGIPSVLAASEVRISVVPPPMPRMRMSRYCRSTSDSAM